MVEVVHNEAVGGEKLKREYGRFGYITSAPPIPTPSLLKSLQFCLVLQTLESEKKPIQHKTNGLRAFCLLIT